MPLDTLVSHPSKRYYRYACCHQATQFTSDMSDPKSVAAPQLAELCALVPSNHATVHHTVTWPIVFATNATREPQKPHPQITLPIAVCPKDLATILGN